MKLKILIILVCNLIICNLLIAQNITNTLGSSGVFTIKDGSTTYFTLNQVNGLVGIANNLTLTEIPGMQSGILFKGTDRFLHTFHPYGTDGANTFLGLNAGNFTMFGTGVQSSYNTGIGVSALFSNTTGNSNVALGVNALFYNTLGSYNTALGNSSLTDNTYGLYNTAVGSSSLHSNLSGSFNVAVGYQSLYYNNRSDNTALGYQSLFSNTTGFRNTAVGYATLWNNVNGRENTAVGIQSLYSNINGTQNTAMGFNSLYSFTTGERNSAFGYLSLSDNTTGSNNTAIGSLAQVPSGTSDNQVRIGNTNVTYAGVQVAWTITSDSRWKQNILPSNLGLGFISKLNPVSYTRTNDETGKTEYGLIAQEVEEVLKESGVDNCGMLTITDEGFYELRYNDLLAPMVKAIQELSEGLLREKAENDELKERLSKIEKMQNILAVEIEKLRPKKTGNSTDLTESSK